MATNGIGSGIDTSLVTDIPVAMDDEIQVNCKEAILTEVKVCESVGSEEDE